MPTRFANSGSDKKARVATGTGIKKLRRYQSFGERILAYGQNSGTLSGSFSIAMPLTHSWLVAPPSPTSLSRSNGRHGGQQSRILS